MTLCRDYGNEQFLECEECPETTDSYDRDEFDEMIRAAKEAGWSIQQEGSSWTHKCPDCAGHGGRLARAQALFRSKASACSICKMIAVTAVAKPTSAPVYSTRRSLP